MSDFAPEELAPELPSELLEANEDRGEVSIVLGGMEMILRPSHDAIRRMEKGTGKSVVVLAMAADESTMLSDEAAIVTTALIRAGGTSTSAKSANADKVGRLIYEEGLMTVMPRLSMVLGLAATGGCTADGRFKSGEATAPVVEETAGAVSPGSPLPPSDGPLPSSGTRRRTSSTPPTKPGAN